MCAWSDCFVKTDTGEPFGAAAAGSGSPVSRGSIEPSSSSRRSVEVVPDPAADADHHALRPVPAVDERRERLPGRGADGLLGADDVAAERVVAVEELVVDAADEVARRVEVHVHLLDDDALLALDLLGVEARVADHVDEHVERDVAGAGGALDVVARVLLAGEGVELAADPVDLGRDVAGRRAAARCP